MSAGQKNQHLHLRRPGKKSEKVAFDQELKSGGAGTVYSVKDNPELVIKCYHSSVLDSEGEIYREKIECMLVNAPNVPAVQTKNGSVVQLAWPVASVYTLQGTFIGFAMPTIDFQRTTELEYALMEKQAKQHGLRHDLGARILLAHNLAGVVSSIHAQGHAIVDLKPINLKFYKEELFVAVLDCDGFFIKTPGKDAAAPQVTPEYLAPEFHGAIVKNPEHQDRFALAVIIFRLLNYNIHPFSGVPRQNENVPSEIDARIKGGLYPYGNILHKKVYPVQASVHEAFPQELRELFDRAFSSRPTLRPSSADWAAVLNKFADKNKKLLERCSREHLHFAGMPCLSCLREQIISKAGTANKSKQVQQKISRSILVPHAVTAPQPVMAKTHMQPKKQPTSSLGNPHQVSSTRTPQSTQFPLGLQIALAAVALFMIVAGIMFAAGVAKSLFLKNQFFQFVGGPILIMIVGLLVYFAGPIKIFRAGRQLLNKLINVPLILRNPIFLLIKKNAVGLTIIAGLLWYFAGGFILLLIIGLLWFFVGLEKILRVIDRLLDLLIKKSVVPRALIAGKLRTLASLVKNRFAVHMPNSFPIKRVAVGLTLIAGVLWFFVGMVKDHLETSRINERQPVLVAAQQENTKQKFSQEAAPQPVTATDAAIDISTEQVDSTGDSLSMEESVNSGDLTIGSDSAIESSQPPGQPIPDQSVAIEPPRIQDSVAENEKPPSPPILSTQVGGSQDIPPEQGFESGKKSDPNNEVVNSVARNDGAVTHEPSGWIGAGYKPLSPQVIHSMGLASGQGILISEVPDRGPAARAGVAVGDILISVDGKNVGAENVKEVISGLPLGEVVKIEVIRNDTRKLLTVRVEPRP